MNKRKIRVGIFSSNLERAREQMRKLIKGHDDIQVVNLSYAETETMIYQLLKFSENTRGYRNHFVWIDSNDMNTVDFEEKMGRIVIPTLVSQNIYNDTYTTSYTFIRNHHIHYY